jgi:hypothetical protein
LAFNKVIRLLSDYISAVFYEGSSFKNKVIVLEKENLIIIIKPS